MTVLERAPLHPALFAAVFVLQPAFQNGVEPPGVIRPLLLATVGAGLVTAAAWLLMRRWSEAGLVGTAVFVLVVSREPVVALLVLLRDSFGIAAATAIVGGVCVLAIWAVAVFSLKTYRGRFGWSWVPAVTRALNIFGGLLVTTVLLTGAPTIVGWASGPERSQRAQSEAAEKPDVYLLMLDGYARDDVLRREFSYDNEAFLRSLEGLGVQPNRGSHSNYTYSALTFTSMFEVAYVRDEPESTVTDGELRDRLRRALTDGPAVRALHDAGYELVATAAGWEHDTFRGSVDRFLDRPELTDFERQVLQRTWLLDVPPIPSDLFFTELHKRIDGILADAVRVAAEGARAHPVFAFVHVPAPHLPMAFGSNGEPAPFPSRLYGAGRASEFGLTEAEYDQAYGNSISQLNDRVLDCIRRIREGAAEASRPEPVIIVMSDHGYIGDEPIHDTAELANLYAATSLSGVGPFDPGSPVNLIPEVLRALGAEPDIEPLADRYFTTVIDGQTLHLTEIPAPRRDDD